MEEKTRAPLRWQFSASFNCCPLTSERWQLNSRGPQNGAEAKLHTVAAASGKTWKVSPLWRKVTFGELRETRTLDAEQLHLISHQNKQAAARRSFSASHSLPIRASICSSALTTNNLEAIKFAQINRAGTRLLPAERAHAAETGRIVGRARPGRWRVEWLAAGAWSLAATKQTPPQVVLH